MPKRERTRERIIRASEDLFKQAGYSRTTIDDLSSALGMSRKTIYQYFPGKYEILRAVGNTINHRMVDSLEKLISDSSLPYIAKLQQVVIFLGQEIAKVPTFIIRDIQKNVPDLWSEIQQTWENPIYESLTRVINEGIELGFIRKDLPVDIAVLLFSNAVQNLLKPDVLAKVPYNFDFLLVEGLKILFEGILTQEGREQIKSG